VRVNLRFDCAERRVAAVAVREGGGYWGSSKTGVVGKKRGKGKGKRGGGNASGEGERRGRREEGWELTLNETDFAVHLGERKFSRGHRREGRWRGRRRRGGGRKRWVHHSGH
jgi:hypothetical protein